jgi:ligand-binding sensor domain-containing protein
MYGMNKAIVVFFAACLLFLVNKAYCQWVHTGVPTGGSVISIAAKGDNVYAGTETGGVFLLKINKTLWIPVNTGLTNKTITALSINGGAVFAGTAGGGVFFSTNNGESWAAINSGLSNMAITALASEGNNIFAGSKTGVFYSANNGSSWIAVNTGLSNTNVTALAINQNAVFAGTGGGVFRSTNNGASWTAVNTGLANENVLSLASSDSTIFAGTDGCGLFFSSNNGASWSTIYNVNNPTGCRVDCIAVNKNHVFAGVYPFGVWESVTSNNGVSWTSQNVWNHRSIKSLAVSGTVIFAGDEEMVFQSTDNGTFWAMAGLADSNVTSLTTVNDTNIFAGTAENGIFLSQDNGTTWFEANTGLDNKFIRALTTKGSKVFAGTKNGLFVSANHGSSWDPINKGLTNSNIRALGTSDNGIFAGTDSGLFFSGNDGGSWVSADPGPKNPIDAIASKGNTVFVGSVEYAGLYVSSDNGRSWTNSYFGIEAPLGVYALASSGTNILAGTNISGPQYWYEGKVVIPGGGGIFLSENNGGSWSGWAPANARKISAFATKGNIVFAGTNVNLFSSENNGSTWTQVFFKWESLNIAAITFGKNCIFIGAVQKGIYCVPLSQMLPIMPGIHSDSPRQTALQVRCFHANVLLNYRVPSRCLVHIGIYALSGKRIAIIEQGEKGPGEHVVTFNSENVPNGIYTCRLLAGSFQTSGLLRIIK